MEYCEGECTFMEALKSFTYRMSLVFFWLKGKLAGGFFKINILYFFFGFVFTNTLCNVKIYNIRLHIMKNV